MVYIFLAKGFEEIEAVSTIDILRRANIEVTTVSISDEMSVVGAHNIAITVDALYNDLTFNDAEMLVLPGGMPGTSNLADFQPLNNLLHEQNKKGKWIAAICAAPLVLGRLNILRNHQAVCYPGFEDELLEAYISKDDSVVSGNIITAKGPGCANTFAFEIIKALKPDYDIASLMKSMILS